MRHFGAGPARVIAAVAVLLLAAGVRANELIVDARTLETNDLATITVTLEGAFAANDFVDIPLQNLAFVGEPYVASEFAWIQGEVVRRKTFRYRVRPLRPGAATVGPIELTAQDGQSDRLAAVALQVLPDRAGGSNDAEAVLRELLAMGRDPFFVVAELDKQTAFVGEPMVVTWVMYNAAAVQQWQVVSVPKLADFWIEELARGETPERVYVGDVMVQRLPIRRVALYPLRSGAVRIEGLTVEGALMRRIRGGPFSMFDGELVETTFTSAPIDLEVKPIPAGAEVDAVGNLALTCDPPLQRGRGPVVVRVTLSGRGNARSAEPPKFASPVAGTLQIEGGEVTVARDEASAVMTRRWRYLVFPSRAGSMEIPPLVMTIFDPEAGSRRELRCAGTSLQVTAAPAPRAAQVPSAPSPATVLPWPLLVSGAAVLFAIAIAFPRIRREWLLRRESRAIVHGATAAEVRHRMEERVRIPLDEPSDRGDAWRSLRSLLDAAERERDIAAGGRDEIEARVREVLRIVRR